MTLNILAFTHFVQQGRLPQIICKLYIKQMRFTSKGLKKYLKRGARILRTIIETE